MLFSVVVQGLESGDALAVRVTGITGITGTAGVTAA